jgi:hypothetical protein
MPKKERQPGFIYMKSEALEQEIAFSEKSGWVFCEDGIRYSPGEIKIMKDGGQDIITLGVHNVKKVFNGEVVKVERNIRGNGQAKSIESGTGNGIHDTTNPGEKISDANRAGQGCGGGELDIF